MSDDRSEAQDEQPEIVHDDIVQRLLDYQRQLREGATPDEAAEQAQDDRPMIDYQAAETLASTQTDTIEVVDVAAVEAESDAELEVPVGDTAVEVVQIPEAEPESAVPTPSASTDDPSARVAELETEMARLGEMVGALRDTFQDMAITADERLAAIEATIAAAKDTGASE